MVWDGMGSLGMGRELRTWMDEKWRPTAAHRGMQHTHEKAEVCESESGESNKVQIINLFHASKSQQPSRTRGGGQRAAGQ